MPKTVSLSEARSQLNALLQWAIDNGDGVVVESRGEPRGVFLSYGEYGELLALREQARRREALQQLEALALRIRERNAELSPTEVEQIAEEIPKEAIRRMVEQGTVRFQS